MKYIPYGPSMLSYEMYTVYGMKFSLHIWSVREMGTYDLRRSLLGGRGSQDHRYSMDVEG